MLDLATQQRKAFCRQTLRYNGSIRRAALEFCAALGAGLIIGQVIDLVIYLSR